MRKIDAEVIAEIQSLRASGMTYTKIAETLGIGKTSASKYSKMTTVSKKENVDAPIKKLLRKEVVLPKKLSRKEKKAMKKARKHR